MSKPTWTFAPKWAMFLAQDADGSWFWWSREPIVTGGDEDFWMPHKPAPAIRFDRVRGLGRPTENPEWTTTLESRP